MSERTLADDLRNVIFEEAIPRSKKILFDRFKILHVVKVTTYCSVLEQSAVLLRIIESGLGYHSYPLLRAQMEGLADIINLVRNPSYLKNIEYQYEESFRKQLIAANNGNPYFREFRERLDVSVDLSESGKRLKALARRGARRLEPKEKLNRAGMKDEYEALYGFLNDHSHGGIKALLSRHLHTVDDDHEVVAFTHVSSADFAAPMQTSLDIVLRASVEIHDSFGTGEEGFFRGEIERLSIEAPAG